MPVFDSNTLLRFYSKGEAVLSDERPFLVDRLSLALSPGVSTYTLPDYVRSIRRITYYGNSLDPLARRHQRDAFGAATQRSTPYWYVFNNVGLNKIQLFPVPNVTVALVTDLWSTGISPTAGCIIEFYRISDNSSFVLPSWIKRQLLKQFVAHQCFMLDGPGNNIKLVKYFGSRWEQRKAEFIGLLDELFYKPRKLGLSGSKGLSLPSLGTPAFPYFGGSISVNPSVPTPMRVFTITGAINGTDGTDGNAIFILNVIPSFFQLFVAGERQTDGLQYTRSGATITFVSPSIPITGDVMQAEGTV